MGAVYDVVLKMSYNNEQDIIDLTRSFVERKSDRARFSDVDYSTLETTIGIILPKRGLQINSQTDTTLQCDCGFDASYGWGNVVSEWFEAIAQALNDDSKISIYVWDEGEDVGVVRGGAVVWGFNEDTDEEDPLQYALDCINTYCASEYGSTTPYTTKDDLTDIGILYTEDGDENEHSVEVSVDLVNFAINYFYDGGLTHSDTYDSLQDLFENALNDLDWDWLYSNSLDYADEAGARE